MPRVTDGITRLQQRFQAIGFVCAALHPAHWLVPRPCFPVGCVRAATHRSRARCIDYAECCDGTIQRQVGLQPDNTERCDGTIQRQVGLQPDNTERCDGTIQRQVGLQPDNTERCDGTIQR